MKLHNLRLYIIRSTYMCANGWLCYELILQSTVYSVELEYLMTCAALLESQEWEQGVGSKAVSVFDNRIDLHSLQSGLIYMDPVRTCTRYNQ